MKTFKKMKLFPKTFFFMLLLFGVVILIMHISIYCFLPKFYLGNMQKDLEKKLDAVCSTLSVLGWNDCDAILEDYARQNAVNLLIQNDGAQKTYQGTSLQIMTYVNEDQQFTLGNIENIESVLIENRDTTDCDGIPLHLQISVSVQPLRDAMHVTFTLLPFTSGIAVLFSVLFSWLYSKKITKPIHEMLLVTRQMKDLSQDAYFQIENEDEISILAEQINEVYHQLWQTIDSLEKEKTYISEMEKAKVDFLRSASHELKTPLAGLRITLENMQLNVGKYKDHTTFLGESIKTVDALSGMVREILDSSRMQSEIEHADKNLLNIKDEISFVLKDYEILAKSKGLTVDLHIEDTLQLTMNQKFFRRLWSNLISNAVRYSDSDGQILIKGTSDEISIWNSCTPLSENQLSHVFEAFYRPDFARDSDAGGTGLGLYLVKEILDANQLSYRFLPKENGMCFSIKLPASKIPADAVDGTDVADKSFP